MLGSFLEIGVTSRDLLSSLAFYQRSGCSALPVGDIVATPYAVVRADEMFIGLHDREFDGPALTFVRPNVADCAGKLRARGVELELAELADDRFNRIAFAAPGGQRVLLLEARTFAPAAPDNGSDANPLSVCGRFVEWSMPCGELNEAVAFWSGLGFTAVAQSDRPHAWVRLAGCGTTIGLHARAGLVPGAHFSCDTLAARLEFLEARGVTARRSSPLAATGAGATLLAPEGTALYLHEAATG